MANKELKNRFQIGFTLIELVVVIAIMGFLSAIILFSVTQYIAKGKDSNIKGSLAVLIPAGEVFYNGNTYSYENFCINPVVDNEFHQMPPDTYTNCVVDNNNLANWQSWAACAQEFTDNTKAWCVDSRAVQEEIDFDYCQTRLGSDSPVRCPAL